MKSGVMPNLDQAQEFLARVVPWPQEGDDPAFINLHWTFQSKNFDKPGWGGRACTSLRDAIKALEFGLNGADTRDIYFCTSSQRDAQTRTSQKGWAYHTPIRNQQNAMKLKALFIDLDFKDYATQAEAGTALAKFLADSGMPRPTLMVHSGGGIHAYWTMARALSPQEWAPLAYALAEATKKHGLKCDTQCTIDSARVLRVPQTFNRKQATPRPVTLLGNRLDFDYSVERLEKALEPYKTIVPSNHPAMLALPYRPPLQGESELCMGIDMTRSAPVDLAPVAKECGFIKEALVTGGKDFDNPLWNLTTLLATFTNNGRVNAHLMARGHVGYSRESTDELFERKERDSQEKNLGWPRCATISATGAKACQGCPHFAKGRSPLNLAHLIPAVAVPVAGAPAPGIGPALLPGVTSALITDLPDGYVRGSDGVVSKLVTRDDGTTATAPLMAYPMTDPWLQRDPWILHFSTIMRGRSKTISLHFDVISSFDMRKSLQAQGLVLGDLKLLTEFLVGWIQRLQNNRDSVKSTPFGWNMNGGRLEGFVFGGHLWAPSGSSPAANPDPIIAQQYAPSGDLQPWLDAAKMITSQGRPGLEALVAASFGAPLVKFTGQQGLLMSVYSMESGIGKSTALRIAQSVWGDPIKGMQSLSDTQNSVIGKIGELRSLPMFWDELKTEEDTRRFVTFVFQLGQGKEKSRMTSKATQRDMGTWQTLLCSASNESLLDYVTSRTRMTTAGLYRVFEYEMAPGSKGQIDTADAQRIVAKLNDNYGVVGLEYAKFLGTDFVRIDKEVGDFLRDLNREVNALNDERFWLALITCVCLGARYANQVGFASFDEDRLKGFMLNTLMGMRMERAKQPIDMKDAMNVSNQLAQFLNAMRTRHTLFTNRIHVTAGKPAAGSIVVTRDASRLEAVQVHVGETDKILRISSEAMSNWLKEAGLSRHLFIKALQDSFFMKVVHGRIGAGTQYAGATEYLLEIQLGGHPLANFIDEA